MPRVLIADDNSNIQKMVSLALKDAGIEVVGVNNGEAAVRKMPEILPDLVLADIFMPVRSGYEVCEFVKGHPKFMHIPVVLLAGAFDPFDEREAQRVQADGVLKKPFVPPDPLVSMVTSLLAKVAGERLVPVGVSVSRSEEAEAAKHPSPIGEAFVEQFTDDPPEEVKLPPSGMTFADDKTLAFGSLLESPIAPAETDAVVTATRDPVLGDPAFWAPAPAPEPEPLSDEELPEGHAWNELVAESTETSHAPLTSSDLLPEIPAMDYVAEEPKPFPEILDLGPANDTATLDWPPAEELVTEDPPLELPVAETTQAEDLTAWGASPAIETEPQVEEIPAIEPAAPYVAESAMEIASAEPISSQFSAVDELPAITPPAESTQAEVASTPDFAAMFAPVETALSPAVESALEHARRSAVPASPEIGLSEEIHAPLALEPNRTGDPFDPELFEAVVARVIDRMQPKMIEIVTREILRPVVEALVRRELEKQ